MSERVLRRLWPAMQVIVIISLFVYGWLAQVGVITWRPRHRLHLVSPRTLVERGETPRIQVLEMTCVGHVVEVA